MKVKKNNDNIFNKKFIEEKIKLFQEIIQNTILSSNKYKFLDILNSNDINICINDLENLFKKLDILSNKFYNDSEENFVSDSATS